MAVAVEVVGVCSGCGQDARLKLDKGRRSVVCDCGDLVPEAFFAVCGYGDAARESGRTRIQAALSRGDETAAHAIMDRMLINWPLGEEDVVL